MLDKVYTLDELQALENLSMEYYGNCDKANEIVGKNVIRFTPVSLEKIEKYSTIVGRYSSDSSTLKCLLMFAEILRNSTFEIKLEKATSRLCDLIQNFSIVSKSELANLYGKISEQCVKEIGKVYKAKASKDLGAKMVIKDNVVYTEKRMLKSKLLEFIEDAFKVSVIGLFDVTPYTPIEWLALRTVDPKLYKVILSFCNEHGICYRDILRAQGIHMKDCMDVLVSAGTEIKVFGDNVYYNQVANYNYGFCSRDEFATKRINTVPLGLTGEKSKQDQKKREDSVASVREAFARARDKVKDSTDSKEDSKDELKEIEI